MVWKKYANETPEQRRERKIAQQRARSRRYFERHKAEGIAAQRAYRASRPGFIAAQSAARRARGTQDKFLFAHQFLSKGLARGLIQRPDSCSICGIACIPQGHHHDYTKPFDVTWLCRKCHAGIHRMIEKGAIPQPITAPLKPKRKARA
jgi:hypothetical protein